METAADVTKLYRRGLENKPIQVHLNNQVKGKSHTIFSIQVDYKSEAEDQPRSSKLNFIELAGSERISFIDDKEYQQLQ